MDIEPGVPSRDVPEPLEGVHRDATFDGGAARRVVRVLVDLGKDDFEAGRAGQH